MTSQKERDESLRNFCCFFYDWIRDRDRTNALVDAMRTARLDHNPDAGITFITLCSAVSQPMHTRTGEVPEPVVPKIDADWPRLLGALLLKLHNIGNVAREIGHPDKSTVGKWIRGVRQPSAPHHAAIVRAYRKWVSPNVPGVAS